MGTESKIESVEKEDIVNDINDEKPKVDENKLAALKARAAQKRAEEEAAKAESTPKEENVPPRIVEERQRSLRFGVIGSGQAGCVDKDTNLAVSGYGILPIKDLWSSIFKDADISNVETYSDGICVRIPDSNLWTTSINPETGDIENKRITAVWKVKKQGCVSISTESKTSLKCSKTHPSLVFEPKTRKRAFWRAFSSNKSISNEDRLFDTRGHIISYPSNETFSVRGVKVTPDIAWLLGVFAGDGSTKKSGNEISFYVTSDAVINRIKELVSVFSTSISVTQQQGCKKVSVFGLGARLFFESAFDLFNGKSYGGHGSKTYTVDIPRCVSASTPEVRTAFISGLIDSDGTIAKSWCETSIFTVSKILSDKLGCLIGSIGGRSTIETVEPRRDNESIGYRIRINGKINHGPLMDVLVQHVTDIQKHARIKKWFESDQQSFTTSCVPLYFSEISGWLKDAGMTSVNNISDQSGVSLGLWSRGERKLSIQSFNKMLDFLDDTDQVIYLKCISDKLDAISSVDIIEDECEFYDLTVEDNENYVAGNNGFIFTHNSRLAEQFHALGYPSVVMNTAPQDLEDIKIPEQNKLLLDFGLGGAAKDLTIGHDAADAYRAAINDLVHKHLGDAEVFIFCTSLGGGSGAGSVEVVTDILSQIGLPVVVLTVLPKASEDALLKHNAWQTLHKLTKLFNEGKVHNIIAVDNARIEALYSDVGPFNFFRVSNKAIVEPIDVFNRLSRKKDEGVKALDSSEFGKLFIDGQGFTVYGEMKVEDYEDEMAIATAIVESLKGNLLASGFDIHQARYAGFMLVAPEAVWNKIPSTSLDMANSMIQDATDHAVVYPGIYREDTGEDCIKVYSMFSGLGLPEERVNQLKAEAQSKREVAEKKDEDRKLHMKVDVGEETSNKVEDIKKKIKNKASAFSKLHGSAVKDRRK
jgi:tubulin-like protein CetZ